MDRSKEQLLLQRAPGRIFRHNLGNSPIFDQSSLSSSGLETAQNIGNLKQN